MIPIVTAQSSCKEICAEESYNEGICRILTGGKSCFDNEVQKEFNLYCDMGKVCCCEKPDDGNLISEMNIPLIITDNPGLDLPEVILKPLEQQKLLILKREPREQSVSSLFKIFFKKLLILLL